MGKRTNTILQSAFFKLADVMPIDDAVEYMKAAAKKSYGKKGDAVVQMNWKAIDAGLDAEMCIRDRCAPGSLPKSFLVTDFPDETIYISQLSPVALKKRAEKAELK